MNIMARSDFLLGADGDLEILNGDLATGGADDQHVADILNATKGAYKQTPLLGVGIGLELNGVLDGSLKRSIRLNLEIDNYKVINIGAKDNKISLDYEDNFG